MAHISTIWVFPYRNSRFVDLNQIYSREDTVGIYSWLGSDTLYYFRSIKTCRIAIMGLHIIKVVSNSSGILGQILIYITHDNFFHDNFPMTSKTLKTRNAISPSLSTILTSSSFDKFSKALQGTPRKNLKTRDSH